MGSFADAVAAFAEKVPGAAEAVFRQSAQDIAQEMSDNLSIGKPNVVTGFLRASMAASLTDMPVMNSENVPAKDALPNQYAAVVDEVITVIAGANIEDTIHIGFTAAYARRLEYGFKGSDSLGRSYTQDGYAYIRNAVLKWEDIVNANAAKVRALIG